MRIIHSYCFAKCAMLAYHLGLELRGGLKLRGWGYYLLYPLNTPLCTLIHPFYPFSPFFFFPTPNFFPQQSFTFFPTTKDIFLENSMVLGKQVKDYWGKNEGLGKMKKGENDFPSYFSPNPQIYIFSQAAIFLLNGS